MHSHEGLIPKKLIALATSLAMMFVLSFQPVIAAAEVVIEKEQGQTELPTALDDDFFDDLPFEQRRQALRNEVEHSSRKPPSFQTPEKYNFLIR